MAAGQGDRHVVRSRLHGDAGRVDHRGHGQPDVLGVGRLDVGDAARVLHGTLRRGVGAVHADQALQVRAARRC